MSINSHSLEGLTHGEVVTMLKNAYGNIALQVNAWSLKLMLVGCYLHADPALTSLVPKARF